MKVCLMTGVFLYSEAQSTKVVLCAADVMIVHVG